MRYLIMALAGAVLTGPAFAAAPGAINCAKAAALDEKAVCSSYDLGQLDAQMATQYGLLKGFLMMGARGALMDDQHEWLASRSACRTDKVCLQRVYGARIDALQRELERIRSLGPF